jgi:hypothetical protein
MNLALPFRSIVRLSVRFRSLLDVGFQPVGVASIFVALAKEDSRTEIV